jgi:hypothetical protein
MIFSIKITAAVHDFAVSHQNKRLEEREQLENGQI